MPDWRDHAAYRPLLEADRALFAWEWLRRDPDYRRAWARAASEANGDMAHEAAAFGLVAFEAPDRSVPEARPCWRPAAYPYVLEVAPALDLAPCDRIDFGVLSGIARHFGTAGRAHLLLSDGLRFVRLDGPQGAFGPGSVGLHYQIRGLAGAAPPLLTLRRFLALCRTGRFSRSLHPPEARAARWLLWLRAHDALAAGAGQREIAGELLNRSAGGPRWRIREPSVRSRAQRLVRAVRHMQRGGWRGLLD